jgi:hypothetical protein
LAAQRFKEIYWKCLADEAVRVLPRNMSAPDFVIYIKGRCPDQRQQFRVALVDYLALRHSDVAMSDHFSAADYAISTALDDVASAYVDMKTKR